MSKRWLILCATVMLSVTPLHAKPAKIDPNDNEQGHWNSFHDSQSNIRSGGPFITDWENPDEVLLYSYCGNANQCWEMRLYKRSQVRTAPAIPTGKNASVFFAEMKAVHGLDNEFMVAAKGAPLLALICDGAGNDNNMLSYSIPAKFSGQRPLHERCDPKSVENENQSEEEFMQERFKKLWAAQETK